MNDPEVEVTLCEVRNRLASVGVGTVEISLSHDRLGLAVVARVGERAVWAVRHPDGGCTVISGEDGGRAWRWIGQNWLVEVAGLRSGAAAVVWTALHAAEETCRTAVERRQAAARDHELARLNAVLSRHAGNGEGDMGWDEDVARTAEIERLRGHRAHSFEPLERTPDLEAAVARALRGERVRHDRPFRETEPG